MKILLTSITIVLLLNLPSVSFSQNNPVSILKTTDSMSDEISYMTNRRLVVYSDDEKSGFGLSPYFDEMTVQHIIVRFFGIGTCNEDDELIMLFDDGSRITKKSWNQFGCDNTSFFRVSESDYLILKNQKLTRLRFTNGRTFDSLTSDVSESNQDYFMKVINLLENEIFEEVIE